MSDPQAPLRVLIVDDEAPARSVLREMLGAWPDVAVVGECADGFQAVKAAGELHPHLLLLDVQMPKLDGFEVLELLDRAVSVVFVTAYDQYALRAFEVNAVDYLLKPFSAERLRDALDRVRTRTGRTPEGSGADIAAAARPEGTYLGRIVVKDGADVHVIPVDTVDYLEAQADYVEIHAGKSSLLKQQTLQSLETALDPARFVRIHRSYVLNLDRLARIEPATKDSRVAVLKDGRILPVSRAGYLRIKELLS